MLYYILCYTIYSATQLCCYCTMLYYILCYSTLLLLYSAILYTLLINYVAILCYFIPLLYSLTILCYYILLLYFVLLIELATHLRPVIFLYKRQDTVKPNNITGLFYNLQQAKSYLL